jgi:hypothetical protein
MFLAIKIKLDGSIETLRGKTEGYMEAHTWAQTEHGADFGDLDFTDNTGLYVGVLRHPVINPLGSLAVHLVRNSKLCQDFGGLKQNLVLNEPVLLFVGKRRIALGEEVMSMLKEFPIADVQEKMTNVENWKACEPDTAVEELLQLYDRLWKKCLPLTPEQAQFFKDACIVK